MPACDAGVDHRHVLDGVDWVRCEPRRNRTFNPQIKRRTRASKWSGDLRPALPSRRGLEQARSSTLASTVSGVEGSPRLLMEAGRR